MKKLNLLAIVSIAIVLSFSSCETVEKSEKVVDEFYDLYIIKDFAGTKSLSSSNINSLIEEIAKNHYDAYGEIISWEKYNTEVFSNSENTGAKLYFKCKYAETDDILYEKFTIIEDGDEYKIAGFIFDKNKDIIDNEEENYLNAKNIGKQYYEYLINDELDNISSLMDNKFIIDAGNEESFYTFINNRQDYYGNIISFSVNKYVTNTIDEQPVFIIVYDCITEHGSLVEELSIIKRNDEFKIYNYRYSDTFEGLEEL